MNNYYDRQDRQNMSDFIIYVNIFGEFDNWDAAPEKERSAVICKKKTPHDLNSINIILI